MIYNIFRNSGFFYHFDIIVHIIVFKIVKFFNPELLGYKRFKLSFLIFIIFKILNFNLILHVFTCFEIIIYFYRFHNCKNILKFLVLKY